MALRTIRHRNPTLLCFKLVLFKVKIRSELEASVIGSILSWATKENWKWQCELCDTENLLVYALNLYCSKWNSIGTFFGPLNFKHRVMSDERKLELTMRTMWHRKPTRSCFKLVLFKAKFDRNSLNFKHRVMSDKRKLKLTMRTIWHRKPTRACFKLVLFKAKIHSEYFSVPWSKHRVMSDERKLKLTLKTLWHPKSTSSCRFRWRFRRR